MFNWTWILCSRKLLYRSWVCFKHNAVFWSTGRKLSAPAHLEEITHNGIKFSPTNRKHGVLQRVTKWYKCKTMLPLRIIAVAMHYVFWSYKRKKEVHVSIVGIKGVKNKRNDCINYHSSVWQNVLKMAWHFFLKTGTTLLGGANLFCSPKIIAVTTPSIFVWIIFPSGPKSQIAGCLLAIKQLEHTLNASLVPSFVLETAAWLSPKMKTHQQDNFHLWWKPQLNYYPGSVSFM